ncbi:MAG: FtsH protease activity modulator HflK, partial [Nitrospirae bacterium]|nr:FtsH protease activity modulator HflK [Nitrospirota bacterium]
EFSFLTGEYSFADLNLQIHYKVKCVYAYLYNCQAPERLLGNITYRIVRAIMGTRRLFPSLTVDRDILEEKIKDLLQAEADNHSLGIEVVTVAFRDMHPPTDVAPAFEDVVSAHEDYETYINEAQGYRNQILPMARGEAERVKEESSAYRNKKLVESNGEANRFRLQLRQYEKAKEITKTRLYLETLEEALPEVNKFIVALRKGEERPELWFYEGDSMPLFIEKGGEKTGGRK